MSRIKVNVISFEVLSNASAGEMAIVASGDGNRGAVTLVLDVEQTFAIVGRLLGGLDKTHSERVVATMRSVLRDR